MATAMTQNNEKQNKRESHNVPGSVISFIVILMFASCFGGLSQTALNAMFTGIAADFSLDVALGQWVTTIYMLVLGITVPAVTFLSRRFSSKTIIVGALTIFLLGAVIDVVAWDFWSLIIGRVLQAISTGVTMPLMMSSIMVSFPRGMQATVMGIAGIAMGFAPNIGPTIGGWMVGVFGWRSFFVALALVTLVMLVLACILVKQETHPDSHEKFESISFILSAVGFGGLLLGLSNASSYHFSSPFIWVPFLIGCISLAVFVLRQKRIANPLINMKIFSSGRFTVSFWAGNFLYASFMGITLILPLFIENVWGGTALDAGLALLPGTFAALFFNPLAGFLTDKIGARPVIILGGVFLFVGGVLMVFVSESTPFWLIVVFQGIRAIGVSSLVGPLSSWGMANLPNEIMTDASSFSTAVRQACASFGTALMVFVATLVPELGFSSLVGYQVAFAVAAVFALLLLVSAVLWIRSDTK